jgi:hypothetical protein
MVVCTYLVALILPASVVYVPSSYANTTSGCPLSRVDDVLYLVSDRRSCSELEIRNSLSAFRHGIRPKMDARARRIRFECAYNTFTPLQIQCGRSGRLWRTPGGGAEETLGICVEEGLVGFCGWGVGFVWLR